MVKAILVGWPGMIEKCQVVNLMKCKAPRDNKIR